MLKMAAEQSETVDLKVYYESLCPACKDLDQTQLKRVINLLSPSLNIKTYPYGNADTWEDNGKVEFKCQHGPEECHGNMLHACSLQHNPNHTQALLFNICMMESTDDSQGSDDAAAARCASEMNVEVYKDAIIECANGEEGVKLHKYYGEESKKANFNYVPFVLINGQEYTFKNSLMEDICAAFKNPPETCRYSSELLNG
ncbi:gamma-interferon-inducible lysosomal thiol reductase-like isoform X2 [Plodia interpunctella]|uniref:gamma-interferon-inducible lysosomal thiol reductase-like isoform X2 n=1 Tax=Plodia interpunctella TaxID=58824 RepID=UPI00236889A4|nr:gamma-interferon-inducible lysosomal thiol reductase-like isoform X2 [Plodia interpunctella]